MIRPNLQAIANWSRRGYGQGRMIAVAAHMGITGYRRGFWRGLGLGIALGTAFGAVTVAALLTGFRP